MSYYVLFPLFFFPPVIHMSVIFSRFSSLPLSYLLLCIRIFYVFDTRMIRYWRNLLFHCDRPWILCNLFTFRAMLLNILELWNMTRLRFALLHAATLYYFTLGGSLRCQHNVARTRKWYGVLWEACLSRRHTRGPFLWEGNPSSSAQRILVAFHLIVPRSEHLRIW